MNVFIIKRANTRLLVMRVAKGRQRKWGREQEWCSLNDSHDEADDGNFCDNNDRLSQTTLTTLKSIPMISKVQDQAPFDATDINCTHIWNYTQMLCCCLVFPFLSLFNERDESSSRNSREESIGLVMRFPKEWHNLYHIFPFLSWWQNFLTDTLSVTLSFFIKKSSSKGSPKRQLEFLKLALLTSVETSHQTQKSLTNESYRKKQENLQS